MNDLYDILGFSITLIDTEDYCDTQRYCADWVEGPIPQHCQDAISECANSFCDIKRYCADWVEGDPPSICTDAIGRCAESLVDMTASYTF